MKKRSNLFIGLASAMAILAAPFVLLACQTANSQLREQGTMMGESDRVSEKRRCQEEGKKDAACQHGQCGCGE